MYFLTSFNLGCNAGYPVPSIPYSMMIYQSFLCWHLGQKLQLCVFHILRTQWAAGLDQQSFPTSGVSALAIEYVIYSSTQASTLSHTFVLLDSWWYLFTHLLARNIFNTFFNLLTCPQVGPVVPTSRSSAPAFTAASLASVLKCSCFSCCPCLGYLKTTSATGSILGISYVSEKPQWNPPSAFSSPTQVGDFPGGEAA